jgi:hypothetical protein
MAICLAVTFLLSCGGSDQQVLNKFFAATRAHDNATVAAVSLIALPDDLEVQSWEVVEVRAATNEPFRLPELSRTVEEAKTARDDQFEEFSRFRLANYDDLMKIEERLDRDPEYEFKGGLAEIRAEYEGFREERRKHEYRLRDIQQEIEEEKKPATKSLMSSTEIEKFAGEVLTKDVLLTIETGSGEKPYLFTLRKYNLTNQDSGFTPPSRWIITNIEEQSS